MAKSKRQRSKTKINYTNTKKFIENFDGGGFVPTLFKLPEGMKFYKWKKGKNKLDFMPFKVGKHNQNADEGMVHWEKTFLAHNIPTADGVRKYACLQNWKKPCPVCKSLASMRRKGKVDDDTIKKMEAKTRRAFIIKDRLEKDSGFQLLETGHFKTFGEMLQDVLDTVDDDSPILDFWHLEDGMAVLINAKGDTYEGRAFNRPTVINFEPRKTQYEADMLDEIPCLDELLKRYKYEELEKIFNQGEDDEPEDEDDEVEGEEDEDEDDESESDDDVEDDDDGEEDEEDGDEGDEDEDSGKKGKKVKKDKKKTKPKKNRKKEEDDDDDADDEDDGDDSDDDDDQDEEDDSDDETETEEEEDDEEGNEDDDEEADEEDGDDDSGDDDSDKSFSVGQKVWYKDHKSKKKMVGKITKVNKKNRIALIDVKGLDRPAGVDFEDLHDFEEEDEPKKKKPKDKRKKDKRKKDEDEDYEISFDDEDEDEDEPKKRRR